MPKLIVLMYHRVGKEKHANTLEMYRAHFLALKERFQIVLPGDPLTRPAVCLTFDDATFDFYHSIFPLLKEFKMRVVLGVPVRYILEKSALSPEERLAIPYPLAMQDGLFETKAPFCTWEELQEMVASGLVEVASHSYSHCNLTFPFVDLEREVIMSKNILEKKLPQVVSSFIYPFGKVNGSLHKLVSQYYSYTFRIGSALNRRWISSKPLSRIPADNLPHPLAPLSSPLMIKYTLKSFLLSSFFTS